jgi:hypothetical protein
MSVHNMTSPRQSMDIRVRNAGATSSRATPLARSWGQARAVSDVARRWWFRHPNSLHRFFGVTGHESAARKRGTFIMERAFAFVQNRLSGNGGRRVRQWSSTESRLRVSYQLDGPRSGDCDGGAGRAGAGRPDHYLLCPAQGSYASGSLRTDEGSSLPREVAGIAQPGATAASIEGEDGGMRRRRQCLIRE